MASSVRGGDGRRGKASGGETLLFSRVRSAPLRMCLVYPNRYEVAMGNLGYQAVYAIAGRHPGVVCERAFLPGETPPARTPLASRESGLPLHAFDVVAFSISFETDYLNVPRLLRLGGIEPLAERRKGSDPIIIAGGPAIFLNPEPIADFIDAFFVGEAEEMLPEALEVLRTYGEGSERVRHLEALAQTVDGAYVPRFFEPRYDGPCLVESVPRGPGPARVRRRLVWNLDAFDTTSTVLAPDAVFGDMFLVEASRGCQWGCRFCAAGYMYRPVRNRSPERILAAARKGLAYRKTIGLIGAEMASVPGVDRVAEEVTALGGRLSPSSLKADCVTPRLAGALARSGTRTVTVAPEAGSERMRRVINKNLTEAEILRAADLLVGEGVPNLKLYFMIGLPGEAAEDADAIVDLTLRIRERLCAAGRRRGRVGQISISLNPFVPKPWTPFQWEPMETIRELRGKIRRLQRTAAHVPNVTIDAESPREAYLQTLLSRGDRRIGRFLLETLDQEGAWWQVVRAWKHAGLDGLPDPDGYVHRAYGLQETLPWDVIDHGISKSFLLAERRKAFGAVQTAPCDTATCTACGAC